MNHIKDSLEFIRQKLVDHRGGGVVLWSGGKDSMVLLDLCRKVSPKIAAVHFSEPWFPRKNLFVHKIAAKFDLRLYLPDPMALSLYQQPGGEDVALVTRYHIGGGEGIDVPKDVIHYEGAMRDEEWICGRNDHLGRPRGAFEWKWALSFIGHKSVDEDPILGNIPLKTDFVENENATNLAYPLREWTDAQIWDYIEARNLPVDTRKYDRKARQAREDKGGNTDYVPACVRCLSLTEPEQVFCPLMQRKIENEAANAPRTESLVHDEIFTPEKPEPVPA